MLSDILPTGFEIGVLAGRSSPGTSWQSLGGPVGRSALLTSRVFSPGRLGVLDAAANRLDVARQFVATDTINVADGKPVARLMALTDGVGGDVALEAVGLPATFDICPQVLMPGGRLANVDVHSQSVELRQEQLWIRNVTITTAVVNTNTTPLLMKTVRSAGSNSRS